MAAIRKINWTVAMRDMCHDRSSPVAPGYLASVSIEWARLDRLAKEAARRPFFVAGSFDRSAIMKTAIAQTHLQRAKGNKASWSQLLSSALKFAWICAKTQLRWPLTNQPYLKEFDMLASHLRLVAIDGSQVAPALRRPRGWNVRREREEKLAIIREHLGHITHSMGRIQALASELEASLGLSLPHFPAASPPRPAQRSA